MTADSQGKIICSYFVSKKNRCCRMRALKGSAYCGEHIILTENDHDAEYEQKRMQCPLDPSHTCSASLLEKHLKKCNATKKHHNLPPCYVKNINLPAYDSDSDIKVTVGEVTDQELLSFISKIRTLHEEHVPNLMQWNHYHDAFSEEIESLSGSLSAQRHLKQQAALLSLAQSRGLLSNNLCYVEFGAGRGHLSYWIIKSVADMHKCSFVLVDRASQRHKYDNRFRVEDGPEIERIRMDIEHLYLNRVPSVLKQNKRVVGYCKHLCGEATDFTIRCLVEPKDIETHTRPVGMVLAVCCHHRCKWKSYCGRTFLQELGISQRDFSLMCSIAGWATCGAKDKPDTVANEENVNIEEKHINRYKKLGLSAETRKVIGNQSKQLIDLGRVKYLQQNKMKSEMVFFIPSDITPENVVIIAVPDS